MLGPYLFRCGNSIHDAPRNSSQFLDLETAMRLLPVADVAMDKVDYSSEIV